MILSKCFKCGGDRVLISNSMQRPDYASHTEDECLIALNERITKLETLLTFDQVAPEKVPHGS